jgi:hypothetical protein
MADDKERSTRIAALNDALRKDPSKPLWVFTAGVMSRGPGFVNGAINAVKAFTSFTADNDPYGEHDFGSVTVDGIDLYFKIDCFDADTGHSFGASNPEIEDATSRVLTIMLVAEY